MNEFTKKINNIWQKRITLIKKSLDIDSTMLEVVNVHRLTWIILIYNSIFKHIHVIAYLNIYFYVTYVMQNFINIVYNSQYSGGKLI